MYAMRTCVYAALNQLTERACMGIYSANMCTQRTYFAI